MRRDVGRAVRDGSETGIREEHIKTNGTSS